MENDDLTNKRGVRVAQLLISFFLSEKSGEEKLKLEEMQNNHFIWK